MGFIYLIRNMVNAKPYVGQTTEKIPQKRWNNHVPGSMGPYLLNAYAKYGRENFSYSILCECPDEKLNEYEQSYVKLYSSMCPSLGGIGYNLTLGGLAGGKLCEETKQKIGDALRGVPKSEESKKKLSETRKAMNWTPSPEHKEKLLYASRQNKTPEHRHRIGLQNSKKVDQFTLEGIFIKTHSSARAAGSELNIAPSNIGRCCAGKQKTSGGYMWKFSMQSNF